MYKIPLKHIRPLYRDDSCHYQIIDKEGIVKEKNYYCACHSNIKNNRYLQKGCSVLCLIPEGSLQYSIVDVKRYIKFLGTMGFKCKYVEKAYMKLTMPYYEEDVIDRDFHVVQFELDNYKNRTHLFAGLTAFRYVWYEYAEHYTSIPEKAFEIKSIYGKNIQNIQTLTLAAFILGETEEHHAFMPFDTDSVYLCPQKIFDEHIGVKGIGINGSLGKGMPEVCADVREVQRAWNNKDYKKVAELVKIKYEQ